MKFQPGHEKLGGRKPGTRNRRTNHLYEVLEANGFSVVEKLVQLLPQLNCSEQVQVLLRLLPYLYPERKEVDGFKTGELVPIQELEIAKSPDSGEEQAE